MEYQAQIREIPEHTIYFKEYFVSDMAEFFQGLAKQNFLQDLSDRVLLENPAIRLTDPEYNVILYPDGEYKETDVRIEFCDAVTGAGGATSEYGFRTVPRMTVLSVAHRGPYHRLSEAYDFAVRWMEENGYRKAGCPRSSAVDGFWNKKEEEDYLTEMQIPVEKKSAGTPAW